MSMYRIKLEVNGNERQVNNLDYEYFCPVEIDTIRYRKFLQKNFPYNIDDYLKYRYEEVPSVEVNDSDRDIQWKCKNKVTSPYYRDRLFFADDIRDPFEKDKTKSNYYYELGLARYDAGLDKGLAPNYRDLYDRLVRPLEDTTGRIFNQLMGGQFYLTLDSSDNDDFFYGWMFSEQMHQGQITLTDEQYQGFKIEFWDCYCVGIKEVMCSDDQSSMQMTLRLSPAITRNRKRKHMKSWKITEIKDEAVAASSSSQKMPKEKPCLKELYWTDLDGNRLKEPMEGMNILVVNSINSVGKKVVLNLKNPWYDFKYNDLFLEDDIIDGYTITSNSDRLEIEAF